MSDDFMRATSDQEQVFAPEMMMVGAPEDRYPVDARKLHSFLGVKARFDKWIRDRIERFGFQEIVDYRPFFAMTQAGQKRASAEYQLSLGMAKELCMVEWSDKGREARRYFIQCEERLRSISIELEGLHIAKGYQAAAVIVEAEMKIASMLGTPASVAKVHAVTEVSKRLPQINLRPLLAHNPDEVQELDMTPTDLAKELGVKGPRELNMLLAEAGMQVKTDRGWEPTEKGRAYGVFHRTAKRHSDGTPVQQLKWKKGVLKTLSA